MALTDKEIEHFNSELPEGMRVVDFREIRDTHCFIREFCATSLKDEWIENRAKMYSAIHNFIEHVKTKK